MEAGGDTTASAILLKPGVGSSYGNGWRQLWKNFGYLLLTGIIVFALTVIVGFIIGLIFIFGYIDSIQDFTGVSPWTTDSSSTWFLQIVNGVANVVYFTPVFFGLVFVYMTAARGEKVEIENIFAAFKNYGNVIVVGVIFFVLFTIVPLLISLLHNGLWILGVILTIIWTIFSIYLYCKLAFVPYLLLDKKMKATESIETSWRMTNGHGWKVFLIGLLGVPITIAGFICLIIGSIISTMWIIMALGSLYHAVDSS